MTYEWTPERVARVRQMHGDGFSASQIARSISAPSRNSVCGKIARMGMTKKAGAKPQWRTTVVTKPIPPPPAPPPPPPPEPVASGAISTLALTEHTCKWPLNDGPDWRHCGAAKDIGGPYCEFHRRVAFSKQPTSQQAKSKAEREARIAFTRVGMGANNG